MLGSRNECEKKKNRQQRRVRDGPQVMGGDKVETSRRGVRILLCAARRSRNPRGAFYSCGPCCLIRPHLNRPSLCSFSCSFSDMHLIYRRRICIFLFFRVQYCEQLLQNQYVDRR